jgi:phospholipase/carboxylesterase
MKSLDLAVVGEPGAQTAVVLLHGWGAPGDDLVPLAEALVRPGTTFYMPAGPLPEMGGGRAWWHLDLDRPAHAHDEGDPIPAPHAQVAEARAAIQRLLAEVRKTASRLYLGGFSQGAMLSLDVALAEAPPVDKVFALSGVFLADSLAGLKVAKARPPVFVAHGRQDQVLPYRGGQRIAALLEGRGFPVTFQGFDGGHEIPPAVLAALASFLFG